MPESAISLLHLKTSSTWMSVSWRVTDSALGGVPVTIARESLTVLSVGHLSVKRQRGTGIVAWSGVWCGVS